MAPSRERIERLRRIPMFADLSEDSLSRIAAIMTEFEAPAGRVLIKQGEPGSGLLIVDEGTVVVERAGRRPIELGAGEFLGDLALLSPEGVHQARVRTTTPSVLLGMSRQDFDNLLRDEPRIAVAMLPTLARRIIRADTDW